MQIILAVYTTSIKKKKKTLVKRNVYMGENSKI